MSTRKSVPVTALVTIANRMLAAPGSSSDGRIATAILTETLLMEIGQYAGFRYLPSELTDNGTLRAEYDDTRRHYLLRSA